MGEIALCMGCSLFKGLLVFLFGVYVLIVGNNRPHGLCMGLPVRAGGLSCE
jgi:hypothetical protein